MRILFRAVLVLLVAVVVDFLLLSFVASALRAPSDTAVIVAVITVMVVILLHILVALPLYRFVTKAPATKSS
jgi:hypothetical protein